MTTTSRLAIVIGILASALGACSKTAPEPPKVGAAARAPAMGVVIDDRPGAFDPNDAHGTRKLRNLDAPVYVDGKQVAVLRYGDLAIAPAATLTGGTPIFSLVTYLRSLGLSPAAIRAVHLHGNGDRVGSIEGRELAKQPERFTFTFSSQTTGAALQRWDTEGLKNEFVVHELRKVSVFVARAPAAIHPQRRCHLGADGACTTDVPYREGPELHGTRVYVDGRIVGFAKRRQLTDAMVLGETEAGERRYALARFVAGFGVEPARIKHVEIVAGDDVVGRAGPAEWASLSPELYFTLPRHNHGKVRVHVPFTMQTSEAPAADRDALATSILVYTGDPPTTRPLSAISEDTDLAVQLASNADEGPAP